MNNYKQHQKFLNEQIYKAQQAFPKIRIFKRHVGTFFTPNGARVAINKRGMADLWALLPHDGRTYHLEIEIKTGAAELSKFQKKWLDFCNLMEIPFFLVNPESELVEQLIDWTKGEKNAARKF